MKNNQTVVFVEPKKAVIKNCEIPKPKENQVLIKTKCTLVSIGTELTVFSGEFPKDSDWEKFGKFPFIPGYNNIGKVIDVGKKVDKSWIGRRIASYGTHSKYVVVDTNVCRLIHRDIKDEEAVFFTIVEIVMNSIRRSKLIFGESVVCYGLGLLGQIAVRLCRLSGALPVFAVDTSTSRLKKLPRDKMIIPINPLKENVFKIVKDKTRGRLADIVFEVTGNNNLITDEFKVLRKQGRFVVLSSPRGKTLFDFHDLCNSPSYTIIGAHNSSHPQYETFDNPWTKHRDDELFFDLVADKEIDVSKLISLQVSYTKAPEIYKLLLKDRSTMMGVIFEW